MKNTLVALSVALLAGGFVASASAADDTTPPTKTRAQVKAETKAAAADHTLPNTGDKPNNESERATTPKKKKAKTPKPATTDATPTTTK